MSVLCLLCAMNLVMIYFYLIGLAIASSDKSSVVESEICSYFVDREFQAEFPVVLKCMIEAKRNWRPVDEMACLEKVVESVEGTSISFEHVMRYVFKVQGLYEGGLNDEKRRILRHFKLGTDHALTPQNIYTLLNSILYECARGSYTVRDPRLPRFPSSLAGMSALVGSSVPLPKPPAVRLPSALKINTRLGDKGLSTVHLPSELKIDTEWHDDSLSTVHLGSPSLSTVHSTSASNTDWGKMCEYYQFGEYFAEFSAVVDYMKNTLDYGDEFRWDEGECLEHVHSIFPRTNLSIERIQGILYRVFYATNALPDVAKILIRGAGEAQIIDRKDSASPKHRNPKLVKALLNVWNAYEFEEARFRKSPTMWKLTGYSRAAFFRDIFAQCVAPHIGYSESVSVSPLHETTIDTVLSSAPHIDTVLSRAPHGISVLSSAPHIDSVLSSASHIDSMLSSASHIDSVLLNFTL